MSEILEVRMPKYPECWESCGNCGSGDVYIIEVLVSSGEKVRADDNVITLETGKVALDIPTPYDGTVKEVFVHEGEHVAEGALILTLEKT